MATTKTNVSNGKSTNAPVTTDELAAQIELLKSDIASLTSSIGDFGKSKISEVKGQAQKTATDFATTSREKAIETQIRAEDFIRSQPGTAIGIAAGIGFLVGIFSSRR